MNRSASSPCIGVVTVTYNSGDVLDEFIQSMRAQVWTNFRLYAVDNASRDDSLAKLRVGFAEDARYVEIANPDNRGIARGNNQGIKAALADGCELILLLNNDTVFGPALFEEMAAALDEFSADAVVPKMFYHDPSHLLWCAGGTFDARRSYSVVHYGEKQPDSAEFSTPKRIDYAPTCCMLIRRRMFDRIGMMDENFFVYGDDTDFCFRAWKAGVPLWYAPKPVLYHKVGSLTGGMSDFSILNSTRGKVYFIRKHTTRLASLGWLLVYQLLFLARLFSPSYGWRRFLLLQQAFRAGCALTVPPAGTGDQRHPVRT
jgi:GT2 family glycosyltransferase